MIDAHASEPVLVARGLAKHYGPRRAVAEVAFSVRRGEVFGFLGPNGAGKTTTIRMLVGLVRPTLGRVTVGGWDLAPERERALGRLGCIVESPDFYGYLSGRENLALIDRMARLAPKPDGPRETGRPAGATARPAAGDPNPGAATAPLWRTTHRAAVYTLLITMRCTFRRRSTSWRGTTPRSYATATGTPWSISRAPTASGWPANRTSGWTFSPGTCSSSAT